MFDRLALAALAFAVALFATSVALTVKHAFDLAADRAEFVSHWKGF